MARQINRLSARTVQTLSEPGRHADGQGLYLVVDPAGSKRWVAFYQWRGKRREMGLGPLSLVGLPEARRKAAEARKLAAEGVDPINARTVAAGVPTFGEVAHELIEDLAPGWRGKNTVAGWKRTIDSHAADLKGMPVDEVDTAAVLKVLKRYWTDKPESAGKMRERIERVLDAAKARGLRDGENPARWRGHLALMLPKRKVLSRGHFAAMPYDQVPAYMEALDVRHGMSARALEWTILTASREAMTTGATCSEIRGDLWVIPAGRMKDNREHRVPISPQMRAILKRVLFDERKPEDPLFPAQRGGHLTDMAMDMMLRDTAPGYTVHGFRSSFRDWAGDCTEHAREVAEAALAHAVGDAVERSYRRGDALEKRRRLMQDWADFTRPGATPDPGAG